MNRSHPVWTNQGVVKSGEMWNLAWIQIWDDEKVHRSIYCTVRHSECPWSNAWRILFSVNEQGGSDAKYGATFSQDGQQEAKRYQAWTHLFDALAECHLKNRLKSRIGTISKYQDYIRRVEDVCWSKNVLNETNIKKSTKTWTQIQVQYELLRFYECSSWKRLRRILLCRQQRPPHTPRFRQSDLTRVGQSFTSVAVFVIEAFWVRSEFPRSRGQDARIWWIIILPIKSITSLHPKFQPNVYHCCLTTISINNTNHIASLTAFKWLPLLQTRGAPLPPVIWTKKWASGSL